MTNDDYRDSLVKSYLLTRMLRALPLVEMHAAQERAAAVGPLLDPTLYRAKKDALEQDTRIVATLLRAQCESLKEFPPGKALLVCDERLIEVMGE